MLFACKGRQDAKTFQNKSQIQPSPLHIQYAKNFEVRYFDTHKEIRVKLASQTQKYALIPRGKTAPKGYEPSQIIETPIRSCILGSHTHIACLQALGLEDKLVGLTEAGYLPDSVLLQKIKQQKIHEVGKNGEWQNELLFSLKPELVMLSGMGDDTRLNLPAATRKVINLDWQESHPLGRLEWLYFVSLFFEVEEKAADYCKKVIQNYEKLKNTLNIRQITAPSIIFDVPYKGVWYMPAGKSYMATLLKDANGKYAWEASDGNASLTLDFETVYAKARQADIWLNVGACRKIADITALDTRLADIPALRAGKVYSYQKKTWANGANPYFMQSILHPDRLLQDLIKILHSDLPTSAESAFEYYEKIR